MPQGTNGTDRDDVFKTARRQKAELGDGPQEDRLPPHSTEAEQCVLGCILLSPRECLPLCRMAFEDSKAFYDLRHQTIYETMCGMGDRLIDVVTLQQELRNRELLNGVGGLPYLASLPDTTSSHANLEYYIQIMREKHLLRKLQTLCIEAASRIHYAQNADELLVQFQRDVAALSNHITQHEVPSCECATRFTDDIQVRYDRQGAPSGVLTGLCDYDRITGGLQFGEQCIIGARPSVGKTALGLSIVNHACLINQIPTLFITFEMSVEALMRRLCAIHMQIGMQALRSGQLNQSDQPKLPRFVALCRNRPLKVIDYCSGAGANTVVAAMRKASDEGVKLVVVDYLTKISSPIRHEKRTYEVAATSGMLRSCAVANKIALVTLAQLNRECDKGSYGKSNKPRLPRMSDLSDSGQIERDADVIALLHRDKDSNSAVLNIAKNRDGECGLCYLHFRGPFCKFENGLPQQPEQPDL